MHCFLHHSVLVRYSSCQSVRFMKACGTCAFTVPEVSTLPCTTPDEKEQVNTQITEKVILLLKTICIFWAEEVMQSRYLAVRSPKLHQYCFLNCLPSPQCN